MRAIDADALKDYIDAQEGRPFIGCTVGEALKIMTDEQPIIHPEPHWIPVTKPPKDTRICYVTLKDTRDEHHQNWVAEMIYTPRDGFDLMDGIEAIAWMPKQYPEPYKGVNE